MTLAPAHPGAPPEPWCLRPGRWAGILRPSSTPYSARAFLMDRTVVCSACTRGPREAAASGGPCAQAAAQPGHPSSAVRRCRRLAGGRQRALHLSMSSPVKLQPGAAAAAAHRGTASGLRSQQPTSKWCTAWASTAAPPAGQEAAMSAGPSCGSACHRRSVTKGVRGCSSARMVPQPVHQHLHRPGGQAACPQALRSL